MTSSEFISFPFGYHIRDIVARNLYAVRQKRGMTLTGLAEISGLSKDMLSDIENRVGNPNMVILWQLAKALNVPFGQLLESEYGERSVVSDGVTSTLIDNQLLPQTIETYLMEISPFTIYTAQAHMPGVKEHIVLLQGHLVVGVNEAPMYLQPGQTHSFAADTRHVYRSLEQGVLAIVMVVYPLQRQTRHGIFDHNRTWPRTDDEWMGLHLQLARLKLEVSQGVAAARLSFTSCDLSNADMLANLGTPIMQDTQFAPHIATYALLDAYPVVLILPRPHAPVVHLPAPPVPSAPTTSPSPSLQAAIALDHLANTLSHPLNSAEIAQLQQHLESDGRLMATLAARVLSQHGYPSLPARHVANDVYFANDVHPAYARQCLAIANRMLAHYQPKQKRLFYAGTATSLALSMLHELVPALEMNPWRPSKVPPMCQEFDMVVSIGGLNTPYFLQAIHRQLKPGGFFLFADDMLAPFTHGLERNANLIVHYLQYVLDTMVVLPLDNLIEAELMLVESVRQEVPMAVFEARTGEATLAMNRCRLLLKNLCELPLPISPSHPLLAFYRFHINTLATLVTGLDYETEQKTHARQFANLAQHAGFEVCEHQRLYPTHGNSEWDGGSHLFVLQALA